MRIFDDFTQPGFWQDPNSVFQHSFREGRRVQQSPDGGIAILGYEELRDLGMHPAIDGTPISPEVDPKGEPKALNEVLRHSLFARVAPDHRRARKAVLAGLNGAAVKAFAPRAADLIRRRLAGLRGAPFDLFVDLTVPVAAEAWGGFLGYSSVDASALAREVEEISRQHAFSPDPSREGEAEEAATSMLARTARTAAAGGSGPGARMADALGDETAPALVASLHFDAIDTAAAGLAGILALLLREVPDQEPLRDEAFRDEAIEEALRLATPSVFTVRQAREDVAVGTISVPRDAMVWMWWSAGNCDPAAFEEPGKFRPGRSRRGLPFGIGPHACIGHGWTKMLAHLLVEASLADGARLRPVSPGIVWAIGGGRRPQGHDVVYG